MGEKPKVLLVATLDSKEVETRFIRERLEELGLEVYLLDASIRAHRRGRCPHHPRPDRRRGGDHHARDPRPQPRGQVHGAHDRGVHHARSRAGRARGPQRHHRGGGLRGKHPRRGGHAHLPVRSAQGPHLHDGVGHDQALRGHQGHRHAQLDLRHRGSQHRHPAGVRERRPGARRHGPRIHASRAFGQARRDHDHPQHHRQVLQQGPRGARAERDRRSWSSTPRGPADRPWTRSCASRTSLSSSIFH